MGMRHLADQTRQWWAEKPARDAEWELWANVPDLAHLRELTAWFCEGKLSFTPGHGGPRDPETVDIGDALAHANRSGFLTTNSQNGGENGYSGQWRSDVEGLADDATVQRLRSLVSGTRLCMQAAPLKFFRQDGTVPGTHQKPDGSAYEGNDVLSWRDIAFQFQGIPDDVLSQVTRLNYVQIVDPQWGPSTLLWDRLSVPDWDNPPPLADEDRAMPETPPEPPVGTVLETSDSLDTYRIERTDLGWHIQYREGESEFGERLTSFGGRGISWESAWRAWGPPSGAEEFTEVPPGAPPLPARPPEDPPPWADMGADASNHRINMPPAAQPYQPSASPAGLVVNLPKPPTMPDGHQ